MAGERAIRAPIADRWVRVTPGPNGSSWVREGAQVSGAAWCGPLIGRPGSTVLAGLVLNRFKLAQTDSNLPKL
jgi:hypothetical protein